MKRQSGITLVALVITIIVLLILAGVSIAMLTRDNGIIKKAEQGEEDTNKQVATEKMNLKIINLQISSYTENKRMPTLQELADALNKDDEIEYVETVSKKTASLVAKDIEEVSVIFTKLVEYPYEFQINNNLQLALIDGIEITDNIPPEIVSLEGKDGQIIFSASDTGTGIIGYAITTSEEKPTNFTAWNGENITVEVSNNMIVYLWIKDGANQMTSKKFQIHSHVESSEEEGGCYSEVVYHTHTGSASSGTGCYTQKETNITWNPKNFYLATFSSGITYRSDNIYEVTYYKSESENEPIFALKYYFTDGEYSGQKIVGFYDSEEKRENAKKDVVAGTNVQGHYYAERASDRFASSVASQPTYSLYDKVTTTTYSLGCGKDELTVEPDNITCGLEDGELITY